MNSSVFLPYGYALFLALALFEAGYVVFGRKAGIYRFRMSVANLAVKNVRVLATLLAIPGAILYDAIYRHTLAIHLPWSTNGIGSWAAAIVTADFCFYLFHVAAHRWNLIWATHVVHHQSTDFNLSLAGRDGFLESFFLALFFLPFAALGMPLVLLGKALAVVLILMGSLHCRVIGRLGPLEWVLNTPSHHRVHHRKDIAAIGGTRNFGAIFIVWDRLFGTFHAEAGAAPEFGVRHASPLLDPIRCHTYYYRHLFRAMARSTFREKLRLLFSGELPGLPEEPPATEEDALSAGAVSRAFAWLFVLNFFSAVFLQLHGSTAEPSVAGRKILLGTILGMAGAGALLGRALGAVRRRRAALPLAALLSGGLVMFAGVHALREPIFVNAGLLLFRGAVVTAVVGAELVLGPRGREHFRPKRLQDVQVGVDQ